MAATAVDRHGSAPSARKLAEGLGWLSIGLGLTELLAPRPLARRLGMESHTGLIQAYGAREIVTGIGILSQADPTPWIWGRVGGDVLDLATLSMGLAEENPRRGNVGAALAVISGVTVVDALCARALSAGREPAGASFDYGDRRGMPLPPEAMRGRGRDRPQKSAAGGVNPGDEAEPGTPGTGEDVCPACGGTGSKDGQACADCGGSGRVVAGIGGG